MNCSLSANITLCLIENVFDVSELKMGCLSNWILWQMGTATFFYNKIWVGKRVRFHAIWNVNNYAILRDMQPDNIQIRRIYIHIIVVIVFFRNSVKVVNITNIPRGSLGANVWCSPSILAKNFFDLFTDIINIFLNAEISSLTCWMCIWLPTILYHIFVFIVNQFSVLRSCLSINFHLHLSLIRVSRPISVRDTITFVKTGEYSVLPQVKKLSLLEWIVVLNARPFCILFKFLRSKLFLNCVCSRVKGKENCSNCDCNCFHLLYYKQSGLFIY